MFLVKLIAAVLGVTIAFFKLHALFESKTKLRAEFEFAKKFFNSLNEKESNDNSSYTEALGYRALMGNKNAPIDEIKYVLELDNAVDRLKDYQRAFNKVKASAHTHPTNQVMTKKFRLARRYDGPWRVKVFSIFFAISYGVLALIAMAPLLFRTMFVEGSIVGQILWVAIFGFYSALFLNEYHQLVAAKRLVEASEKHIPKSKKKESDLAENLSL
ncbi:hypothetical protein [Photobacterium rosenbergii]|uniref:Uncharacterized protein n=1 Tax=Photobacterium rosenbergii TaxID=294936 RepID=A0ABU3ZLG8_9GAMM|nr:hypothetical protein [Photobacterium rosenbergii]MDV5170977.1 hypothetical protein [Photobacterium rosenbergii]